MQKSNIEDIEIDQEGESIERSELAQEISELKQNVMEAINSRSRLPQPMFWSLFKTRIDDIRRVKALKRKIDENLG